MKMQLPYLQKNIWPNLWASHLPCPRGWSTSFCLCTTSKLKLLKRVLCLKWNNLILIRVARVFFCCFLYLELTSPSSCWKNIVICFLDPVTTLLTILQIFLWSSPLYNFCNSHFFLLKFLSIVLHYSFLCAISFFFSILFLLFTILLHSTQNSLSTKLFSFYCLRFFWGRFLLLSGTPS